MSDPRVLVVVSFYNARQEDQLDNLLWQLKHISAGVPFDTLIVVNQATDQPLAVAGKYPSARVVYRANSGYNIGAWDHGWRSAPGYDFYAFLQDDCLIARAGWLRALVRRARSGSRGSLIGEAIVDPAQTWDETQASYVAHYTKQGYEPARWADDGGGLNTPNNIRRFMLSRGVTPQPTIRHLRALALCAPAALLKATDGFATGKDYRDAVGSEVMISQKAAAKGFGVRQASLLPFTYIIHPQWMPDRCKARTPVGIAQCIKERLLPGERRVRLRVKSP